MATLKISREVLEADAYKKADVWGWHKQYTNKPGEVMWTSAQYIAGRNIRPCPKLSRIMTDVLCKYIAFEEDFTIQQATNHYFGVTNNVPPQKP